MNPCNYVPNSNQPCETCPRLITMLYMCSFLQETEEDEDDHEDEQ